MSTFDKFEIKTAIKDRLDFFATSGYSVNGPEVVSAMADYVYSVLEYSNEVQWFTMESAPKDGGLILGILSDSQVLPIYWQKNLVDNFVEVSDGKYMKEIVDKGCWKAGRGFFIRPVNPIHWMPFPAVPEEV